MRRAPREGDQGQGARQDPAGRRGVPDRFLALPRLRARVLARVACDRDREEDPRARASDRDHYVKRRRIATAAASTTAAPITKPGPGSFCPPASLLTGTSDVVDAGVGAAWF